MMDDVITVRVSSKLKKEAEELGINYIKEIKEYLEMKVREKRFLKTLAKANGFRKRLEKKVGNTTSAAEIIRWDRDYDHT